MDEPEDDDGIEEVHIAVPNLDPSAPPLTDAMIKFGLHNHAEVIQKLVTLIKEQELGIISLMYLLSKYMQQYPLTDVPNNSEKVEVPGGYL